ncbi:hypothetical protein LB518_19310 [Mesorhizobium sp. BR1-1-16]|uniref:hypothetical protein n=1 Tax=Mesorhizobium sp. BR1-1-16 TaxID=2876653 RepID=UPI001CC9BF20|nr:hypothetical protein [Mesorhizobium sp. BR1-1-16]MBZ9938457.1 hypothetical protein [Mesorhizobium sp. BR1-1-16]
MTENSNRSQPDYPYHPEEMRAAWDCKFGKNITLQGTARWTPAGVVTAGIAASAVLLSLAALVRAAHRP